MPQTQETLPPWLRGLYPFSTRTLLVEGRRMSFVEDGTVASPPLLLLHGNPTWSFLYRRIIPLVSSRYRVIAPDHIGFGLSEKPTDPGYYSLDRHIANLTSLVEQLGLRGITLVCHDWGGPIGLGYAVQNPANIARVIVMNTWAFVPHGAYRLPLLLRVARSRGLGDLLLTRLNLFVTAGIPSATRRRLPGQVMDAYRYPFPNAASRAGVQAFPRLIPLRPSDPAHATMASIEQRLSTITAPVDILWGRRDPVFGKAPAFLFRDAFPNARHPVFLDQASHFIQEDAPDAVAAKILEEQKVEKKSSLGLKILQ